MKKMSFFLLFVFLGTICFSQQSSKTFSKTSKEKVHYWLYLPSDYSKKSLKKYPLILFLHGSGESGSDLSKVKINGLPKILDSKSDFPAIVVSPQCKSAREGWNRFELHDLIIKIRSTLNVDTNKVYITGLSMGGRGTWDMLVYYPELFAAAIPVCGWGDAFLAPHAKKVPIWIFHGAKDTAVDVKYSYEMNDALKKAGADVKLTIYPEAGHDSWTETYNNSDIYTWLFSQQKK